MSTSKFVALIPARKGSKGIPCKNIKQFAGRPLLLWVAEAACNCELIDSVYVMTDSNIVIDWVLEQTYFDPKGKLNAIGRKPKNATNKAPQVDVMMEFAERIDFDNLVVVLATSPLLQPIDLYMGIQKYQFSDYDSLVSVVKQPAFIWRECDECVYPVNHELSFRPNREDFPGVLIENGAFIITSRKALLKTKARLSGKVGCYHMANDTYLQIDEPSDWVAIEAMLKHRKGLL